MVETPDNLDRVVPLSPSACTITSGSGDLVGPLVLHVGRSPVGTLTGAVESIEMQVAPGRQSATVQIVTPTVRLNVQADPRRIRVAQRPDARPIDGWIKVEAAQVDAVGEGRATVRLELPNGVEPVSQRPSVALPCSELSLIGSKTSHLGDTDLRPGTRTPLRAEIGGPVVAYLNEPARSSRSGTSGGGFDTILYFPKVTTLDRKPGWLRVTKAGDATAVEGWIPADAASPNQRVYGILGLLSGAGDGNIRCQRDVPLFVRSDGKLLDIGVVRANANVAGERIQGGAIRIDLGAASLDATLLGSEASPRSEAEAGDGPFVPEDQAHWCSVKADD
jgi:hypothetical protein